MQRCTPTQVMLAALRAVDRFSWDADRLTLSNAKETASLDLVAATAENAVALDAGRWQLAGITDRGVATSIIAGTSPFLAVDPRFLSWMGSAAWQASRH